MASASRRNVKATLYGAQDVRIETAEIGPPKANEVTVHVRATSLCGSDQHYYAHGRNGDFALQHPMCLGHESVGEVVARGEQASGLAIGQRVAIEPGMNCGACGYCQSGRYNLCQAMRFASSAKTVPHLDGTLQRFINWPARLCHPLPELPAGEKDDWQAVSLTEPLAVVLQALERARFQPGQSVLVMGTGAVGLLVCAATRHFGASAIVAVDTEQGRLDMANQLGWCDETYINTAKGVSEKDSAASISQAGGSGGGYQHGFDVVFECTGVPPCARTSIYAAKPGGVVCLIGMGHPTYEVPVSAAALREVDIVGVFRYANKFPSAIQLLTTSPTFTGSFRNGNSKVKSIISHVYPLTQADEAFRTLKQGLSPSDGKRVVKVVVVDDGE